MNGLDITFTIIKTPDGGRSLDPKLAAGTSMSPDFTSTKAVCKKRSDGKWGFDLPVIAYLNTTYKAGNGPGTGGALTCGIGTEKLGEHEERHRADLSSNYSNAELNKAIPTEGFSTRGECRAAKMALEDGFKTFAKNAEDYTFGLWDGCRK